VSELNLPEDVDAEQQVIAFALLDPFGHGELLAALAGEDFVSPPRGRVWEAKQEIAARYGDEELLESVVRDYLRQTDEHSQESLGALEDCRTIELPIDPLGDRHP
jgi:hypothetical protein